MTWGMLRRKLRLITACVGFALHPRALHRLHDHPVGFRWSHARIAWVCPTCGRRLVFKGGAVPAHRPVRGAL